MLVRNEIKQQLEGGSGGQAPQKQKKFLKNQTKWRLFLYFLAFWQGSLDPQN